MYDNIIILGCLGGLVAASFYLGYKHALHNLIEFTVDKVFNQLEKEGVIELVEENGSVQVYSGNKFPASSYE